MKAIWFLAFCGIACATKSLPQISSSFIYRTNYYHGYKYYSKMNCDAPSNVSSGCSGTSDLALCTDNCGGANCEYWNSRGDGQCSTLLGRECKDKGLPVPSACGALALVSVKGVLVAVLLLAAFLIL